MSITLVGDVFCDIVASNLLDIPSWGEDSLCKDIAIVAGGSLLNSAVHGANYSSFKETNILVNAFGVVGCDTQGEICSKALRKQPLIVNNVIEKEDFSTGTCIVLSGKQDRLFITSRGCIEAMTLDMFKDNMFQNNATHIHAAGFYNFTPSVRQSWCELFKDAKGRGLTTSLNPQYDASGLWADMKELCIHLDFLITNELELMSITKKSSSREGAEEICTWGCKCVVVTNSEGATAFVNSSYVAAENSDQVYGMTASDVLADRKVVLVEHKQSAFPAEVHDTCGAGDAFAGAFLVELQRSGGLLKASLRAGCIAGTAAVQLVGGSSVPSFELLSSTSAAIPLAVP